MKNKVNRASSEAKKNLSSTSSEAKKNLSSTSSEAKRNNLILSMKAEKDWSVINGERTLVKQPTNHPLITHLRPTIGSRLDAIRKYAAMVVLMLFIGVGQMWGDNAGLTQVDMTYSYNGTSTTKTCKSSDNGTSAVNLGTLTADFEITGLKYYVWKNQNDWGKYGNICSGKVGSNKFADWAPSISWSGDTWTGSVHEYTLTSSSNKTVVTYNSGASGNYSATIWFWATGDKDDNTNCGDNFYVSNGGSNYTFNYSIAPPALTSFTITASGHTSGSGTSSDPYIVPYNGTLTLTSSGGEQARTDDNSSVQFSVNNSSWGTTSANTTKTIANITPTSNQTVSLYAKCYNSSASLSGTVKEQTIYYKAAEPSVTVYDISYTAQSTGWTYGSKPTSAEEDAEVTFVVNPTAGYTVSVTSNDVTLSGPDASNRYTFTMPDNNVTINVSATENKRNVTISAGTGGTVDKTSASVGVATTTTVTATAYPGYRFTGWTATNCAVAPTSSASTTLKGDGSTGAGTLVANFDHTYAFIEGRFHITNSSRNGTWTNTFSTGDWNESSTNIPFEYDDTNHRFYLHTYATPKELTTKISNYDPFFYIKTSTESGRLTNTTSYWSASSTTITTAGTGGKKTLTHTGSLQNANLRFNSSDDSGYTILYFDEAGVWYELEQTLKYSGNGNTGGSAPAGTVYYDKGANATAASNTYTKTGYTFTGWKTGASSGTSYAAGANVPMNSNITLYAQWQINNHAVTYTAPSHGSYTIKVGTAEAVSANTTSDYNKTVTLAATPATGYHFVSWSVYKTGTSATTVPVTTNKFTMPDYPVTVSATFAANTYTVAYNANGGTGTTANSSHTYDVAKALTTNGYSKTGYTFGGWATSQANADAGTKAYDDGESVTNLSSDQGATVTLYAIWTPNTYSATFSQSGEGYSSGSVANQSPKYGQAMPSITPPTAANGYAFMGYFDAADGAGTQYYNADGTSAHVWDKTTDATLYAYFKKAEITGITFTGGSSVFDTSGSDVEVTATLDPEPAGSTIVCWKVLYSNDNPLESQPTFSPTSGKTVHFNTPTTPGSYKIEATLRTGSVCGSGTELSTYKTVFQIASDHTVTLQYKCGDDVIAASTTVSGKPLEWTEVVAHDIFGYTFSSWTAGDGITLEEAASGRLAALQAEDPTIVAVTKMKAIYDGRLTANYTQKNIIYFKNTLGWSDVYVNFYTGSYWNNPKGSGNNGVTNRNKHMTRIGESDVWYFDYGNISPSLYVSFTSSSQSNSENFWGSNPGGVNVVYPANYQDDIHTDKSSENGFKAATPMFVPLAGQTETVLNNQNNGKANYFNRGYWTKYTAGTGYTLEIYNSSGSSLLKTIEFTSTDELMPMKAVADLEANTTYKFQLRRGDDIYYGNSGTMTYANNGKGTGWEMTNAAKAGITTTASGDYTFNLSYSADKYSAYRLRIAVDYPIADGDYRVIYKDNVHTAFKPSAIVPKANNSKDTVSFFVRPDQSSVMKIQQATVNASTGAITWNAGTDVSSSFTGLSETGVYNICLQMNESGAISVENVEAYTGEFYIRTDAANSKWDNYRAPDHVMTYSEYSETNSDFTHYWVMFVSEGANVKFVVANDYSPCISDTLIQQTYRGGDKTHVDTNGFLNGDLPGDGVNIRYMWHKQTNAVTRAYLAPAQQDGSKFLVLRANSATDLMDENGDALTSSNNHGAPDNSMQFVDNENWIYETTVKVKPGAYVKLYGYFHGTNFYFKGNNNDNFNDTKVDGLPNAIQLITGSGDPQKVRVIFDFKTDRLIAAWLPSGDLDKEYEINADVMFIREHQGDMAQLTFSGSGAITEIKSAYGVMRFNKYTLNNKDKSTHAVLANPASIYERSLYFISFPFRVKLNDVFGFGTYGRHWAIQRYNGARRAVEGFWAESTGFWEWMDRNTEYLEPNQGYLLAIDLDLLGEDNDDIWGPNSRSEQIELYFPSYGTMPDITSANVEQSIPSHQCTIDRSNESNGHGGTLGSAYNRTVIDSHWNVMSVPTYVNTSNIDFTATKWTTDSLGPNFLYTWNMDDNTLTPTAGAGYTYHAMHAYMVQYYGKVTWKASSGSPYPIVARRTYAEQPKKENFCLEIQQDNKMVDRTYVVLSNDEEASADFIFGQDMGKEFNTRNANIYTVVENYLPAAGNTLPLTEQTTVVPVGVKVRTAGEYTFAMPEGTNGTGVVLVDTENGTRTNLALGSYTVTLGAGTTDGRFVLEISPVANTPTGIGNVQSDDVQNTKARKVMVDGVLYIVKNGKAYDACGTRVR